MDELGPPRTPVAVALGSNLGDREGHLNWAVQELGGQLSDLRVSRFVETDPVGVDDAQPRYLNGAAVGHTTLAAREVLDLLLGLERARGRERRSFRAARTLDLDLILFGDHIIEEHGLVVPHPRFRDRRFVLEPLVEIASDWQDPVTGRTMGELWRAVGAGLANRRSRDEATRPQDPKA